MMRVRFFREGIFLLSIFVGSFLLANESPKSRQAPDAKPNIVVILADDFGYECVGANGGTSYKTPNLDQLAASGARFEHCYTQPRLTPARGSKRTTSEWRIRVPFVIQWKGHIAPGAVYNHPVIQLDIQPTALAAAGIETRPEWNLDGVNLLPAITCQTNTIPHQTLYWRLGQQNAIRHGDWKLVQYDLNVENYPTRGVSQKKLYHLTKDIGEQHDLASQHPEKVKELETLWEAWNGQLAAPLW